MFFNMNDFGSWFWIGIVGAILALGFAFFQSRKVLKFDEGTDAMKKIAGNIRRGAGAYLKRQFKVVAIFYIIATLVLGALAVLGRDGFDVLPFGFSPFIPFAFLAGGALSQLSAFIGMKIATAANVRTANAASSGLNKGLRVAFASGTVLSFTVVGLAVLDVSIWFILLRYVFNLPAYEIASNMVMFGVGVAVFALFARIGGGIFTKAADVGADLVGKVEAGIPEDDPRNPATIADNVGDNVGDVAGMGADLYESYIKSIQAAMALGTTAFLTSDNIYNAFAAMFLPVALAFVGIIASIIGTMFIRTKDDATEKQLLNTLRKGTYIAAGTAFVAAAPVTWFIMRDVGGQWQWLQLFISIGIGMLAGVLIAYFTEYFTSAHYKPTKNLAAASETGSATIIIGGLSLGMKSVLAPISIVVAAVIGAFVVSGGIMGVGASDPSFRQGLFGVGLAAVGMLSTLGITLACDAYGPVADNAGGIAEMAHMGEEVRNRTDKLDSIGNTTAATGKGFAIGSAALTSISLLVSFYTLALNETNIFRMNNGEMPLLNLDIGLTNPSVLVGMFIGVMVVFVFCALTMSAVQRSAMSIVQEVRRQFKEITGLMEGTAEADFESCVDLCTRSALREMVLPTLLGVVSPIITGLLFGVEGVLGLIAGSTVVGFAVAVFMANAGGAWDNAKKYIESGEHGGKGSDNHKAAVIGDTIGDPFKDTTGPSLNTLFKMITTVAITFVGIVVAYSIW